MNRISPLPFATRDSWTPPDDPRLYLVLSLADDELMIGHRHSYWTGIAPTLEADLAFSSLAQDEVGHALIWYRVAAELTGEDEDTLAFGRQPDAYRHAILLEREPWIRGSERDGIYERGPGDWAATLVRQHAYDLFDEVRLEALTDSSDVSINGVLDPILREERLHRAHARAWLTRAVTGPADGRERLLEGARQVLAEVGGLFEAVPGEDELVATGVLPLRSAELVPTWQEKMAHDYEAFGLVEALDAIDLAGGVGGRHGHHSEDFGVLWEDMTGLFRAHPGATW